MTYIPKPCPYRKCPRRKACQLDDHIFKYWDSLRQKCVAEWGNGGIIKFNSKKEALEYIRKMENTESSKLMEVNKHG